MTDDALRERVARAIADQISEGLGATLRKFCDSTDAKLAREHLHRLPPEEWVSLTTMLAEAATTAALAVARPVIRAHALEEAAKVAYSPAAQKYVAGNERDKNGLLQPGSPYDRGRYDAAAAIRALKEKT